MNVKNIFRNSFNSTNSLQNISHQIELIRTAMPYIPSNRQQPMNLVLKVSELLDTIQNPEPELSTCSTSNNSPIDMEGLLTSLKPLCYSKEAELVNILLNTFRAKKFYQTYQSIAATMEPPCPMPTPSNNDDNYDTVNHDDDDSESLNAASIGNNQRRRNFQQNTMNNTSHASSGPTMSQANASSNRMNSILNNPAMKEMLDSFMTPEQRSTFENISNMISAMNIMNTASQTTPNQTTSGNNPSNTQPLSSSSQNNSKVTNSADAYSTYPRYDQSNY